MFKRYVEYLKDNPEGHWFKRKLFGWGWTPVTWQGWLITFTFVGFILWSGIDFGVRTSEPTGSETVWFFIKLVVAIALLMAICYRFGESPKWQWGIPKDKDRPHS